MNEVAVSHFVKGRNGIAKWFNHMAMYNSGGQMVDYQEEGDMLFAKKKAEGVQIIVCQWESGLSLNY